MGTIAAEISALRERISQAYDVIDQKGGDVPFDRTSWNLSASIDSIRTGGDADPAAIVPVRYLKSTGTQYIDTVRYFTSTNNGNESRMELDFQFDELEEGVNQRIIGVIESTTGPKYYQVGPNGSSFYLTWCQGNAINAMPFDTHRHQLVVDTRANYIWLDGQLSSSHTFTSMATLWTPMYLFARNDGTGQADRFAKGRIYRYRHLQNENIMRDLIPARIGTEGVMYDINTGDILRNKGTGAFEFGLDVIPALSAAKAVEYIEFTGTQGIDTGIYGTLNTSIMTRSQRTTLPTAGAVFIGSRTSATANNITFSQTANTAAILDFGDYTATRITAPASTIALTDLIETYNSKDYRYAKSLTTGAIVQGKTAYSTAFTTPLTLRIGTKTTGYDGTGFENWSGRFYSCQIWEGTTLVRDFVPCRIGTTGYLYDRVSQTLFSNIGTGDFVLGPDVG